MSTSRLSRLLAELKRRKVFRVTIVYAIVAWAVIEVTDTVFPILLLPEWLVRAVTVVVLLGFPVAIVLAWAFDLTPEGVRRTEPLEPTAASSPSDQGGRVARARSAASHLGLGILIALVGFGGYAYFGVERHPLPPGAAGPAITSVAVLPFVNMSSDPEQEYFSDGISEQLLDALSRIPGLQVAARTSSFAFKGKDLPVPEIARQLRVGAVLEGSVRKSRDRVRIAAQLIDATNGYQLWSSTYDRELSDIFEVQDEISRAIVEALQLQLGVGEAPAAGSGTASVEAHDNYLLGLHHWSRRTQEDLRLALEHFGRAVELDPSFARAHAGTALTLAVMPQYDPDFPAERAARDGRAAARLALGLDPTLAEAHAALGQMAQEFDLDWEAAERAYAAALELNPNYATAHQWLAEARIYTGRSEEALAAIGRALELDPLSPVMHNVKGLALHSAGDLDGAIERFRHAAELDPSFPFTLQNLARATLMAGREEEARALWRRLGLALELDAAAADILVDGVLQPSARPALLELLNDEETRRRTPAIGLAWFYELAAERDSALVWLERATDDPYQRPTAAGFLHTPETAGLRADPRAAASLRKLNLQ